MSAHPLWCKATIWIWSMLATETHVTCSADRLCRLSSKGNYWDVLPNGVYIDETLMKVTSKTTIKTFYSEKKMLSYTDILVILENYYQSQRACGIDGKKIVRGWINLFNRKKGAKKWRHFITQGLGPLEAYERAFDSWFLRDFTFRTAIIAASKVRMLNDSQTKLHNRFSVGSEVTLTSASVM